MKLFTLNFFLQLILVFAFCLLLNHYSTHVTDDAFIFFRYVEHLIQGHGIVWNEGESPVEGFSSPTWIFLLSCGTVLGFTTPLFSKIVGAASILGTILIMNKVLAKASNWKFLSILVFCSLGSVYYWSLSGMETGLYMFCFLASFASIHHPSLRFWTLLLGITRPEGFLLLLPWSFLWFRQQPKRRKFLLYAWSPTVVYFIFRLVYFKAWLPNTYYAKVGAPILERITNGVLYTSPVLICLLVILCTFRSSTSKVTQTLFLGCLSQVCVVLIGGGDWMTWGRMLVPMFPFVILLATLQIEHGFRFLIILIYFLIPFGTPLKALPTIIKGETLPIAGFQEGGLYDVSLKVAMDIRNTVPKDATIAINHAGFLPYLLPEYTFIDMTGLNDKFIAHNVQGGLHQKYDVEYILRRKPDLVVLNSLSKPEGKRLSLNYWIGETKLYERQEFKKSYQMLPIYYERKRFGGGVAYILIFSRYNKTD